MSDKIINSIDLNASSLKAEMNDLRNINRSSTNNSSPKVEEFEINETISAEVSTQGGNLNLRSGPGTDNGVIGSIENGTKLEIIEADDGSGWTKVKLADGNTGYVYSEYLTTNVENTATQQDAGTYTVQSGDTLSKIARDNNVTVEELVKANNIENPDYIETGQKIIIPGITNDSTSSVVGEHTISNEGLYKHEYDPITGKVTNYYKDREDGITEVTTYEDSNTHTNENGKIDHLVMTEKHEDGTSIDYFEGRTDGRTSVEHDADGTYTYNFEGRTDGRIKTEFSKAGDYTEYFDDGRRKFFTSDGEFVGEDYYTTHPTDTSSSSPSTSSSDSMVSDDFEVYSDGLYKRDNNGNGTITTHYKGREDGRYQTEYQPEDNRYTHYYRGRSDGKVSSITRPGSNAHLDTFADGSTVYYNEYGEPVNGVNIQN